MEMGGGDARGRVLASSDVLLAVFSFLDRYAVSYGIDTRYCCLSVVILASSMRMLDFVE